MGRHSDLVKLVLVGLVTGAMAAAIWAVVSIRTGYEIGWLAIGVGAAVGGAMWLVRTGREPLKDQHIGAIAVVIAILAILGGKVVDSRELSADMAELMPTDEQLTADLEASLPLTDEAMVVAIADDLIYEREEAGEEIEWPESDLPWDDSMESEYPAEIWAEAEARWAAMTEAERAAAREAEEIELRESMEFMREMVESGEFQEFFEMDESIGGTIVFVLQTLDPMDILWFVLAGFAAYQVGRRPVG